MNKKIFLKALFAFLMLMFLIALSGCGNDRAQHSSEPECCKEENKVATPASEGDCCDPVTTEAADE